MGKNRELFFYLVVTLIFLAIATSITGASWAMLNLFGWQYLPVFLIGLALFLVIIAIFIILLCIGYIWEQQWMSEGYRGY